MQYFTFDTFNDSSMSSRLGQSCPVVGHITKHTIKVCKTRSGWESYSDTGSVYIFNADNEVLAEQKALKHFVACGGYQTKAEAESAMTDEIFVRNLQKGWMV